MGKSRSIEVLYSLVRKAGQTSKGIIWHLNDTQPIQPNWNHLLQALHKWTLTCFASGRVRPLPAPVGEGSRIPAGGRGRGGFPRKNRSFVPGERRQCGHLWPGTAHREGADTAIIWARERGHRGPRRLKLDHGTRGRGPVSSEGWWGTGGGQGVYCLQSLHCNRKLFTNTNMKRIGQACSRYKGQ